MAFFGQMDTEHRLIEQAVGSLVTFAEQGAVVAQGRQNPLPVYRDFLTQYVDAYHHGKEEDLLLPALVAAGINESSGPIHVIVKEHRDNKGIIDEISELSRRDYLKQAQQQRLKHLAEQYAINIWEHIDKEDSVLFAEAEIRLRGAQLASLNQNFNDFESDFFAKNKRFLGLIEQTKLLLEQYPAKEDLPSAMRGEGCYICRHFGTLCQGIEKEWWTEEDWQVFHDRPM